jgi:hypothetical protein
VYTGEKSCMEPTILILVAAALSIHCCQLIGFSIAKPLSAEKPTDTPIQYLVIYYMISTFMIYVMAMDLGYAFGTIMIFLLITALVSFMIGVMRGMYTSVIL